MIPITQKQQEFAETRHAHARSEPAAQRRRRTAMRHALGEAPKHLILVALLCLVFYPILDMVFIGGKYQDQFYHEPWTLSFPFHLDNYTAAWSFINHYLLNSLIVTVATDIGVLALSALSGYVFARHTFPGKEILFFAIISLLMVPSILTLIPQFVLVKNLGLVNTRWALILPYIAGGQVFGIFLLRSFFASLPEELFEAARVDGAGDIAILFRLVLPLSWSIMATLTIFQSLAVWNDIIWPAVTTTDDSLKTVAIGLLFFQQQYATDWGLLMAGYAISAVPLLILFAFASRYFIAGLTSGALKV